MVTSTVLQTQKPTTVIETTTYQRKHRPLSIRTPEASNRLVSSMNGYNIDYSNTKNGYVMVQNTTGVTTYVQITCNSVKCRVEAMKPTHLLWEMENTRCRYYKLQPMA